MRERSNTFEINLKLNLIDQELAGTVGGSDKSRERSNTLRINLISN